jgi:hypothetical protein
LIEVKPTRVYVPTRHPEVGIIDIQVRIVPVHIYYLGRLFSYKVGGTLEEIWGTSPMDLGISHNDRYTPRRPLYERHSLHP